MITTPNANKIWQLFTGKTNVINGTGKCYLGLSTSTPNADGSNFKEPTGGNYSRILLNISTVAQYVDKWGTVANGMVTNAKEICSSECLAEGGWSFTHFGIFDAETGGTPIAFDHLTDPDGEPDEDGRYPAKTLNVAYGTVAVFRKETLQLKLI